MATPLHGSSDRRRLLCGAIGMLAAGLAAPACDAATARLVPWNAARATPRLRLSTLEGGTLDITTLRGQVILLNFWASWCEPCRAELPALNRLASRKIAGLAILGVNVQEGAAAIRRFAAAGALQFPVLLDRDGRAFKDWAAGILPASVLIGRDGSARTRVDGEADWSSAISRSLLQPLLEEQQNMTARDSSRLSL